MIKALLALVLACATCLHAESESFQKEVAASISNAKSGSKSAEALQYLSEKLSQGIWTFDPTPTPEQITSMKPRLKAKALLPNTATAYAPRWEVFQKQDSAGVCKPLTAFEFRTETTLVASDCPSATPKPNAFLVDESGLGSLEQSPAQGEAQRGFIVVGNLEQLSQAQSDDYFTKPQTLTPSSGIQAIALKFLAFVPDDATNPKFVKALKVQAGNLVAEVPLSLQLIRYVESGTGRIIAVELGTTSSGSCLPLSQSTIGCTGLGSATCSKPNLEAAKKQKSFCKPAIGTLGNFIVSSIPSGLVKLWLSSFGTVLDDKANIVWNDKKIISLISQNGSWYALRSDGVLLKGTDVRTLESFSPVSCVKLERADGLVSDSTETNGLSCL